MLDASLEAISGFRSMTGKKFDDIWAFVLCAQSSSDVPTVLLNRPHNSRQRTTVHNTLQGQTVTFIPILPGLGLGMFHSMCPPFKMTILQQPRAH